MRSRELLGEVLLKGVHEVVGGQPWRVPADQQRQVLGHLTALHGLDAHLLQRLGEPGHGRRAVQLAAVLQAPGPREDRRDRVGRGLLAALPPGNFAISNSIGAPPPSGVNVMVSVPGPGTTKSVALYWSPCA